MRRLRAPVLTAAVALLMVSPVTPQPRPAAPYSVVEQDISDLQRALRDGRVTSRQLVEQYFARIDAYDRQGPTLHAYIARNTGALAEADRLDAERRQGHLRSVLHGIPLAIKDNLLTADMPTTAGTLALAGFTTGDDAYQVRRLREQGAIVLGKTNLHELAAGITTVSSVGGQTRNPYDLERNPGGSSGGTAAAVAASLAPAGLGTDTCGSIRIPAAHNNLWGLRPTLGLSSREGIVPLAHSQDVAGPLARSAADLAVLLDATAGSDAADPVTADGRGRIPRSYLEFMGDSSLVGVKVGVVAALMGTAEADAEVRRLVEGALAALDGLGASLDDIDFVDLESDLRETSTIAFEFAYDLRMFLTSHRAPVESLDQLLRWGLYRTELDGILRRWRDERAPDDPAYRAVLARRTALTRTILDTMEAGGFAVLAYPTIRRKAARIGESQEGSNCQLSATTGLPALSMPAGFTDDGLPVGVELLGTPFSEGTLLRIAYAYERSARPRRPPASAPELRDR
ncbi:MAG: amidase [Vicinamibacterales bacterium]